VCSAFFTILISIRTKLLLRYHLHKAVDHNSANAEFGFLVLMLILLSWTKFLQNICHGELASYKFLSET
jgi:hypothetical protein